MKPTSLDHVALWVADRDRIAAFATAHLGMHVIDRTDRFTLVGSDARRGKLTLFEADGPRERGALAHVGFRVSDLAAARASLPSGTPEVFDVGEGLLVTLVEGETDVEYDLDHVALLSPDPDEAAREWLRYGFSPAGGARVEAGGAFLELHEGEPGKPGAAAAQPHRRPRRRGRAGAAARGRGGGRHRCAEHVRGLRLGARPRQARVRRAQAHVFFELSSIAPIDT